jgi:transposase
LNGIERRRKWPDETRIAIVSEALEPGVVVSQVARRHDINPSQLFGWLKQYRAEAMTLRASKHDADSPAFATAMLDVAPVANAEMPMAVSSLSAAAPPALASIEISIGLAMVRIRGAADAKTLAVVLKALRSLA